jgi:hypothetical protein
MRICKAALLRIAATTLALVAAYSALLCIPEPFFGVDPAFETTS